MEAPPEHNALFAAIKNNDHDGVRALVRANPNIIRDASRAAGATKAVGYAVEKIVYDLGSCEQNRTCRVMMIRQCYVHAPCWLRAHCVVRRRPPLACSSGDGVHAV